MELKNKIKGRLIINSESFQHSKSRTPTTENIVSSIHIQVTSCTHVSRLSAELLQMEQILSILQALQKFGTCSATVGIFFFNFMTPFLI